MVRKLWSVIRTRQGVVFAVCCASYIIAAAAMPFHYHVPLTVPVRLAVFVIAVATLVFAVSLTCYFFDAWKRAKQVASSISYRAWMTFETLVGVPFTALCYTFSGMALWVAFFR